MSTFRANARDGYHSRVQVSYAHYLDNSEPDSIDPLSSLAGFWVRWESETAAIL